MYNPTVYPQIGYALHKARERSLIAKASNSRLQGEAKQDKSLNAGEVSTQNVWQWLRQGVDEFLASLGLNSNKKFARQDQLAVSSDAIQIPKPGLVIRTESYRVQRRGRLGETQVARDRSDAVRLIHHQSAEATTDIQGEDSRSLVLVGARSNDPDASATSPADWWYRCNSTGQMQGGLWDQLLLKPHRLVVPGHSASPGTP